MSYDDCSDLMITVQHVTDTNDYYVRLSLLSAPEKTLPVLFINVSPTDDDRALLDIQETMMRPCDRATTILHAEDAEYAIKTLSSSIDSPYHIATLLFGDALPLRILYPDAVIHTRHIITNEPTSLIDSAPAGSTVTPRNRASFTHLMANLMSCRLVGAKLTVSNAEETHFIPVGPIQGGQGREFVVTMLSPPTNVELTAANLHERICIGVGAVGNIWNVTPSFPTVRAKYIHSLQTMMDDDDDDASLSALREYLKANTDVGPEVVSLLAEICDEDDSTSFRHFLQLTLTAHQNEWITPRTTTVYGGDYTRELIATASLPQRRPRMRKSSSK